MKKEKKTCRDCMYCRPVTEEGIVREQITFKTLPKQYLFDDYGEPVYFTCKYGISWARVEAEACSMFRAKRITVQDIRGWSENLPKKWEKYSRYFERLEVVVSADRQPMRMEICMQCGRQSRRWVFQAGEPRYLVTNAISEVNWFGYNQAMLHGPKMPPERQSWTYGLCDNEIEKQSKGVYGV